MTKSIYTLALIAGIALAGCQQTPAQKEEAAQTKADAANEELKTAKQELNAEYPGFRKDAEAQINANEVLITELKAKEEPGGKNEANNARRLKIEELEKMNSDLKSRLYGYEQQRSDWTEFKTQFNRDRNKLRDAFKDFGDDLKK